MAEGVAIQKGLKDVVFTTTSISEIDGEQGRLTYRGREIGSIVENHTFEDVLHLLLIGDFPKAESDDEAQSSAHRRLDEILAGARDVPDHVKELVRLLPADVDPMSALRTSVSALGDARFTWPPTLDQAAEIVAKVPTLVALHHRIKAGLDPIDPDPALNLSANYLYMLAGERPTSTKVKALDAYLTLTAEHGMNASTFAARVTASTQSDLISAITTAIGTLKGPLHGGAPSEVSNMLSEIGTKERAESYLRGILERGERIMGFGHRVYRTKDPRAIALAGVARKLAGSEPWFDLALYVEDVATRLLEEYKPGRRLRTNVEFFAAAVLNAIELSPELFTPTFAVARTGGWMAHLLEQAADNQIIRPRAHYRPSIG